MIQAIVFDADDTLYTIRHSVGFHYDHHFKRYGYDSSEEALNKIIYQIWDQFLQEYVNKDGEYRTSAEHERELWRIFTERVLHTHAPHAKEQDNGQLIDEIYDHFTLPESRDITPKLTEILQDCNDRGLVTAVLTNNDRRTIPLLESLNLDNYFAHIFCACDIGYKKPSTKCFDAVREELDIPAEQILYVGDSYEHDYLAARNAGWQSVHYSDKSSAEHAIEKLEHIATYLP